MTPKAADKIRPRAKHPNRRDKTSSAAFGPPPRAETHLTGRSRVAGLWHLAKDFRKLREAK